MVDRETAGRGQGTGQEPMEAAVARSQSPRQIDRPKMPVLVLCVEEKRRREQAQVSHGDGDEHQTGGCKVMIEVERNPSALSTLQGMETQKNTGQVKMSPLVGAAQAAPARSSQVKIIR